MKIPLTLIWLALLLPTMQRGLLAGQTIRINEDSLKFLEQVPGGIFYVSADYLVEDTIAGKFTTIQAAIDKSFSGDLVYVYPGTYTEQIEAKRGVVVYGVDRSTCVLQNTGTAPSNYPIADVADPSGSNAYVYIVKNMTIQTTTNGQLYGRFGNAETGAWTAWDFTNCQFLNGRWEETNSAMGSSINFTDCNFGNDAYGFNLTGAKTGSGLYPVFVNCYFNCSPRFQSTHSVGNAGATFNDGCSFEPANSLIIGGDFSFTGKRSYIPAESRLVFSATGMNFYMESCVCAGIQFSVAPASGVRILSSSFVDSDPDITVDAGVTISGATLTGNVMPNGIGGSGTFQGKGINIIGSVIEGSQADLICEQDIEIGSASAYYFGDQATNDSWRIIRIGNNLVFQRRESGSWVSKDVITP